MTQENKRIPLQTALDSIQKNISALAAVSTPLPEALGCVLAEDIIASIDQPPFPRSPYDGYALRAADSTKATPQHPAALSVVGESTAGNPASASVSPGQAVRIMTGGAIPTGADCVVPQEATFENDGVVHISQPLSPFENYCPKGEDFTQNTPLVPKGSLVTSAVMAVAASTGYTAFSCIPAPTCSVLSTGDELQTPGQALGPGQIYDSNRVLLSARLRELGLCVAHSGHAMDALDHLCSGIETALSLADVLITTGGVSVGARDLVPHALKELGATTLFHGVSIKPGMPTLLATLHGKPVIALSGNPFAAAVGFEMLARPVLAALAQNPALAPHTETARLQNAYEKSSGVLRFLRGNAKNGMVALPGGQGNGQLRTLVGCNCLIEVPAGNAGLTPGETVTIHLL